MAPALLLVGVVLLLPVAFNIYLSFTRWQKFKGLDELAGVSPTTPSSQPIPISPTRFQHRHLGRRLARLPVALRPRCWRCSSAASRSRSIFKNIIFLPRVLAPTAVGVIWFYVYAPEGVLNSAARLRRAAATVDIGWLYQDNTITPAIIATYRLAEGRPGDGAAAARPRRDPDGPDRGRRASTARRRWQIFRHIVLPLLAPTLLVVSILSVLAGFTAFDLLWVMGVSYPGQRTLSLAVNMYFEAFRKGYWAFGAAIAVMLGVISSASPGCRPICRRASTAEEAGELAEDRRRRPTRLRRASPRREQRRAPRRRLAIIVFGAVLSRRSGWCRSIISASRSSRRPRNTTATRRCRCRRPRPRPSTTSSGLDQRQTWPMASSTPPSTASSARALAVFFAALAAYGARAPQLPRQELLVHADLRRHDLPASRCT